MEIFIDNRLNQYRMILVDSKGDIVTELENLDRPVDINGVKYNGRIRFDKMKGERYYIIHAPSAKTNPLRAGPIEMDFRFKGEGRVKR